MVELSKFIGWVEATVVVVAVGLAIAVIALVETVVGALKRKS